MDVGIMESGQYHPPFEIDEARISRGVTPGALVVAHVHDPARLDHDRRGPGKRRIERVNDAAAQDEGPRGRYCASGGEEAGREKAGHAEY